ncbi:FHA domain-containing protein [Actinomyces weissii]|nr:FHA domain-containing protein [Actinomyces weissii]
MEPQATALAEGAVDTLRASWHLAVLDGPDAGGVVPLRGRGWCRLGRQHLPNDLLVSRNHLAARCGSSRVSFRDPGSANGVRFARARQAHTVHRTPHRTRRLRRERQLSAGTCLRLGASTLQLRRRPTTLDLATPHEASGRSWGTLLLGLVLTATLGTSLVLMVLRPQGLGARLGLLTGLPFMVLMAVRLLPALRGSLRGGGPRQGVGSGRDPRRSGPGPGGWGRRPVGRFTGSRARATRRSRRLVPQPSQVLLLVAARSQGAGWPGGSRADGPQAPELAAWLDAAGAQPLFLSDGDRVALHGPACREALAWWVGQVLATQDVQVEAVASGLRLRWGRQRGLVAGVATGVSAGAASGPSSSPDSGSQSPEPAAGPRPGCEALLLAAAGAELPASALRVVEVVSAPPRLGPAWWPAVAQLAGLPPAVVKSLRAQAAHDGADAGGDLPARHLDDVVEGTDSASVRGRWALYPAGCPSLRAQLGGSATAGAEVDLVTDGPHALVAGTTGSGKSELLLSWITQLALRVPPSALSFVLVDYKGGAAFGPLAHLPHTAGVLTDLDGAGTIRALASMEAEVRRRERLLAQHGAKDLAGLPAPEVPARLVVVVDEFATMAKQHPEVLDTLVRLAAQGRSLGIHLVLASQRPGEGLSPSIRANTSLRICLRVLDPQDSRDLLGHDGAFRLPRRPGTFLLAGDRQPHRVPWCGDEAELGALVQAVQEAAAGLPSPWRPWAEPLPARLCRPVGQPPDAGRGLLLARTDLPEEQRLGWWRWQPERPLLVLGSAGSGRSTALDSACLAALGAGMTVHVVGTLPGVQEHTDVCGERSSVGTVVGLDDPRRLTRLLQLAAGGALAGGLLAVDDVDHVLAAVDEQLGGGEGVSLLGALLRAAPAFGTALVLAAPLSAATTRWAGSLGLSLVLGASQPFQAASAGLPRGVLTGKGPGRGVLLDNEEPLACQVLLPNPSETRPAWQGERPGQGEQAVPTTQARQTGLDGPGPGHHSRPETPDTLQPAPAAEDTSQHPQAGEEGPGPGHSGWRERSEAPQPAPAAEATSQQQERPGLSRPPGPLRLLPLPSQVRLRELPEGSWAVGGDYAAPVVASTKGSVLVVGPAGSGRSTTLRALAQALEGRALVFDDLDQADSELSLQAEQAINQGARVLASATTERALATYRGPVHLLRERAELVVLWPGIGPSSQLAGLNLRGAVDPRRLTLPGRGVLVRRGTAVPVQVGVPD